MGKINFNDLDDYEDDLVSYEPIKSKKKKKLTPIYNEKNDQLDRN